MTIAKIFKSHLASSNFFFKDGSQAAFMLGRFVTDNPRKIAELTEEVESGNPLIYIDSEDLEIDSEALSPMEIIRQEAYNQARADLIASGQISDKTSTSDSGAFKNSVANTATIVEGAADSVGDASAGVVVSAGVSAGLAGLSAKLATLGKAQ